MELNQITIEINRRMPTKCVYKNQEKEKELREAKKHQRERERIVEMATRVHGGNEFEQQQQQNNKKTTTTTEIKCKKVNRMVR